jgi:DNA-binding Lrp family transcriptional regulator
LKLNVEILSCAAAHGEIKKLAVFMHFKNLYSNSCYYNWSIKNLAKKSGLSRTACGRYVKMFLKDGWCVDRDGNLSFVSIGKIYEISKKGVRMDFDAKNKGYKQIQEELQLLILKVTRSRFEYVQKMQDDKNLGNYVSPKTIRMRKRYNVKEIQICESLGFSISIKKIAKIFATSLSGAGRIMKRLVDVGLVQKFHNYRNFGNINDKPWLSNALRWNNELFVSKDGFVSKRLANSYFL